jgi:hypothetical protein
MLLPLNLEDSPPILNYNIKFYLTTSVVEWTEAMVGDPEVRIRFLALSDFLKISWSTTGSTQPREYN